MSVMSAVSSSVDAGTRLRSTHAHIHALAPALWHVPVFKWELDRVIDWNLSISSPDDIGLHLDALEDQAARDARAAAEKEAREEQEALARAAREAEERAAAEKKAREEQEALAERLQERLRLESRAKISCSGECGFQGFDEAVVAHEAKCIRARLKKQNQRLMEEARKAEEALQRRLTEESASRQEVCVCMCTCACVQLCM